MGASMPSMWSVNLPALLVVVVAAVLYLRGVRSLRSNELARPIPRWRELAYFGGLVSVLIAVEPPVTAWAEMTLTARMLSEALLVFVAAPLLVLSAPLPPLWHALALATRQESLEWGLRHPRARRVGMLVGRVVGDPRLVLAVFVGDFLAWHFAPLFEAAIRNPAIGALESLCLLVTALLYWPQLYGSPPFRSRMGYGTRVVYLFAAEVPTKMVPVALVLAPGPIYPYYVARLGAANAVNDQVSAAGVISIMAIVVVALTLMTLLWKWLDADAASAPTLPPELKAHMFEPTIQPTFKGKPLRWTPIAVQGGSTLARPEPDLPDEDVRETRAM